MSHSTETVMKLEDAATQMKIAMSNMHDYEIIRSCINSYISAARSVTFVMQRESSEHPELLAWYEAEMSILKTNPLMRFFNEKRTYSIHKGVVVPTKHVIPIQNLTVNGLQGSDAASITFLQFEGVDKFFTNRSGGVFRMCEQYFEILKKLVGDWLKKRLALGIGNQTS